MSQCGRGYIERKGFVVESYYKPSIDKYVKKYTVPPTCIVDRGRKGKGPQTLPVLRKGTLRQFGYSTALTRDERRDTLDEAVQSLGSNEVFRKLNAVWILQRNTNPRVASILLEDRDYVRREYM